MSDKMFKCSRCGNEMSGSKTMIDMNLKMFDLANALEDATTKIKNLRKDRVDLQGQIAAAENIIRLAGRKLVHIMDEYKHQVEEHYDTENEDGEIEDVPCQYWWLALDKSELKEKIEKYQEKYWINDKANQALGES